MFTFIVSSQVVVGRLILTEKVGGSCCAERTFKIIKKPTVSACLKTLQRNVVNVIVLYRKCV